MSEPLSPKTPGTLVRAKKGAGPLRQEIQERVDELNRHHADIDAVDGDLEDAMKGANFPGFSFGRSIHAAFLVLGLDVSLKELESRIKREFTEMSAKLDDVMSSRCHELVRIYHLFRAPASVSFCLVRALIYMVQTGAAKEHFEKLSAVMAQQREALGEEGSRVKACIEAALEALELDDAWFIQAYPDIQLEPGSSCVGRAREVLNSGNGSLALTFDERVMSDVLVPAIKGHGRLNSSLHDGPEMPYSSPVGGFNATSSPRSPKSHIQSNAADPFSAGRLADYVTQAQSRTAVSPRSSKSPGSGSVLESQVERMLQ
jgi:hypothetical protein